MSASSSELVEKIEGDTSDSENSDLIPQLDGPAEDKSVMEENCVEEETILTHLPTADDPDSFDIYLNNLNQEKIENMSQEEIIHMNAELAKSLAFKNTTEKKKKPNKSKKSKM